MTTPTKTNPAYAALAYRRTMLNDVIFYVKRRFIGVDGDPQAKLVCEDVFFSDAHVPVSEIETAYREILEQRDRGSGS